MNTPTLPDTLSDTLTLAINDARLLDRSLYVPHNRFWHGYDSAYNGKCVVCLAGSIISQSFNVNRNTITTPDSFAPMIDLKLRAINLCRNGDYSSAFNFFHDFTPPPELQTRLDCLPSPSMSDFIGWEQFDSHLDSLEAILPALREIENEALADGR